MLFGTVLGARLGHCLFYEPTYYLSHPLEMLKVWEGGLASHGGALGILVVLYIYSRTRPEQPYGWLLDRIAVPAALAGSFIRLGNLFNSEILGTPTEVPWGVCLRPGRCGAPASGTALRSHRLRAHLFDSRDGVSQARRADAAWAAVWAFHGFDLWRAILHRVRQVRQAAFGEALPLSVGQFLSLPLILVGVILLVRAWGRQGVPMR